jgi:hypothetical protein
MPVIYTESKAVRAQIAEIAEQLQKISIADGIIELNTDSNTWVVKTETSNDKRTGIRGQSLTADGKFTLFDYQVNHKGEFSRYITNRYPTRYHMGDKGGG